MAHDGTSWLVADTFGCHELPRWKPWYWDAGDEAWGGKDEWFAYLFAQNRLIVHYCWPSIKQILSPLSIAELLGWQLREREKVLFTSMESIDTKKILCMSWVLWCHLNPDQLTWRTEVKISLEVKGCPSDLGLHDSIRAPGCEPNGTPSLSARSKPTRTGGVPVGLRALPFKGTWSLLNDWMLTQECNTCICKTYVRMSPAAISWSWNHVAFARITVLVSGWFLWR